MKYGFNVRIPSSWCLCNVPFWKLFSIIWLIQEHHYPFLQYWIWEVTEVFNIWISLKDTGLQFCVLEYVSRWSISADTAEVVFVLVFFWILTWAKWNLQTDAMSPHLLSPANFGITWKLGQFHSDYGFLLIYWTLDCAMNSTHFKHKIPIPSAYKKNPACRATYVTFKLFVLLQVL